MLTSNKVPVTRRNETRRDRGSKRRDVQLVEPVEPHDSDSEPLVGPQPRFRFLLNTDSLVDFCE